MKYAGHDIKVKQGRDGLLHAYIDGRIARAIQPSKYKGILYRRIKAAGPAIFKDKATTPRSLS